jgi:hypothetical protein
VFFQFELGEKASLTLRGPTVTGSLSSTNPMLGRYYSYEIWIGDEVFPGLWAIMDTPFNPYHPSDRLGPQCLETTAEEQVCGFKNYPIELLSLFTLHNNDGHRNYELMLILKTSSVVQGSIKGLDWQSGNRRTIKLPRIGHLRR